MHCLLRQDNAISILDVLLAAAKIMVKTTSLFEDVFVLVRKRFRVSTLLKVLTLAL